MWQFREAVHGLADGAKELGIPVSGGNVSFYNQTGTEAILPTPVVGVLGVLDDVRTAISNRLPEENHELYLLGETFEEFGGSIWQQLTTGELNGLPPKVDLANEMKLVEFFQDADFVSAAHDLSEGGLAAAVMELAIHSGKGIELELSDPFVELFSESASRVIVATTNGQAVVERAQGLGIPVIKIGVTNDSGKLTVNDAATVGVDKLVEAYYGTLPRLFGHAVGANAVVK